MSSPETRTRFNSTRSGPSPLSTIVASTILSLTLFVRCGEIPDDGHPRLVPGSFSYDLALLQQHTDVIVLSDDDGKAQVALVPSMQGRVMTSTLDGPEGLSLGWINHELIASGDTLPHINPYGGEDRFWMGPEGGQYSIFFGEGDPFDLEHWFTPEPIDTEPFDVIEYSTRQARFGRYFYLKNYSGTVFDVEVERTIVLLTPSEVAGLLEVEVDESVRMVAFESDNTMLNVGNSDWLPETGLLSIWILGMFNPSPATTVVIPFHQGPEEELGAIVNDTYFGKVPDDRLAVHENVLFFKGDGEYRSKIGLTPARAKPIVGSYDETINVLTLVQYDKPEAESGYVNSMWQIQDAPYAGDIVNSYNDGPPEPGAKPLGPFYELESSSPAAALGPDDHMTHVHRTFHFQGPEASLDVIALKTLGVSLREITEAL